MTEFERNNSRGKQHPVVSLRARKGEGGGGCHSPSLSEEIEGFLFNRLVKRLFSLRASSHVKGIANLYFFGGKQMKSVCDSVCPANSRRISGRRFYSVCDVTRGRHAK